MTALDRLLAALIEENPSICPDRLEMYRLGASDMHELLTAPTLSKNFARPCEDPEYDYEHPEPWK